MPTPVPSPLPCPAPPRSVPSTRRKALVGNNPTHWAEVRARSVHPTWALPPGDSASIQRLPGRSGKKRRSAEGPSKPGTSGPQFIFSLISKGGFIV